MTLPGGQFFEEFIDDFFSESDEHLGTVRRVLLDLEAIRTGPAPDGELQEVSRALHTLKGLSGMVGLGAAEEIAHAMEDAVNALRHAERIPPELLETLFVGETLLERAVAMRRERTTPPSPGPYVDRVRDVLRMVGGTDVRAAKTDRRDVARTAVGSLQGGENRLCRFEFVPSPGLAARGVGVEMIRQRLGGLGEIKSTTPRVRDTGGLSFEFVVALSPGARVRLPEIASLPTRFPRVSWYVSAGSASP